MGDRACNALASALYCKLQMMDSRWSRASPLISSAFGPEKLMESRGGLIKYQNLKSAPISKILNGRKALGAIRNQREITRVCRRASRGRIVRKPMQRPGRRSGYMQGGWGEGDRS
jgi:hypothetical protein